MEKKLAAIYNRLATQISTMIPAKWDKVYYLGEVEKGRKSWSSVFYYTDTARNEIIDCNSIPAAYEVSKKIFMDLMVELDDILLELYDCFCENGQEPWEQVSFIVDAQGKFTVDFRYNVMNEDSGGQVMRETLWAYETFGYVPKAGTYTRRILDKWLGKHFV